MSDRFPSSHLVSEDRRPSEHTGTAPRSCDAQRSPGEPNSPGLSLESGYWHEGDPDASPIGLCSGIGDTDRGDGARAWVDEGVTTMSEALPLRAASGGEGH